MPPLPPADSALPYRDTKPQGSADFYFATNATFRFLIARLGPAGWRGYLEELGRGYFAPVNQAWRAGGLPAVARYWREFFAAEPGAEADVEQHADRVEVRVKVCPAIKHLRNHQRAIVPEYCRHCAILGAARAAEAGLAMRLCGGGGSCTQVFALPAAGLVPQDPTEIAEVRP